MWLRILSGISWFFLLSGACGLIAHLVHWFLRTDSLQLIATALGMFFRISLQVLPSELGGVVQVGFAIAVVE